MFGRKVTVVTLMLVVALLAHGQRSAARGSSPPSLQQQRPRAAFRVPSEAELRDSAYRVSALRGKALLLATRDSLPRFVGSSLRCVSCHLGNGLQRDAMPWIGAYARFPQYRARSGKVELIEDRVNDCFERSMNGKPLDPRGRDMRDIVAYLAFLSTGIPVGAQLDGQGLKRLPPLVGNLARGGDVFRSTCTRCHGSSGQGTALAPPLWGSRSYNTGAGMANINTAAAFIHALMPIDRAQHLTPQQAYDVATFINTRPRSVFTHKSRDWPHGGKPPGADYRILPPPSPPTSATRPSTTRPVGATDSLNGTEEIP